MTKKEILNKLKALALAGTMGATLTACNPEDYREDYEKEKEKVVDEIVSRLKEELATTTQYTQTSETTTTYTTATTEVETTVVTVKPETTTQTTQLTTQATTQTTELTTQTSETTTTYTTAKTEETLEEELNEQNIIENKYKIIDQKDYKITITDEYPNIFRVALKFHPDNMSIENFINYIKVINGKSDSYGTNTLLVGEKLSIPVRTIYYTSNESIENISEHTGISVESIKKLNDEKTINCKEKRNVLIKLLPIYSRSYKTDTNENAIIYSNTVILGNFGPCEKAYEDGYVCGGVYIEQDKNFNEYYYTQFELNRKFKIDYVGTNIDSFYSVNGIPIFKIRNEKTCEKYANETGIPTNNFYTSIKTAEPSKYHFYKDAQGNECYTIDTTNLVQLGFINADDIAEKYLDIFEKETQKTK